jgi:acyl carrier protein
LPPLRGVIHAAGVLDDGVLNEQSWERFERVLSPKVLGAWHLHRLTREMPLDFFVLYSSAASVLGSPGQSNYATANAFLDALAWLRQSQGLVATSVNWGPWADGGMGTNPMVRTQMAKQGLAPLKAEAAHAALTQLLRQGVVQATVLNANWQRMSRRLGNVRPPLLEQVLAPAPKALQGDSPLIERLRRTPSKGRQAVLVTHLQEELKQILSLPKPPDPQTGFFELGMDSLMAVELQNRLQTQLGDAYTLSSTAGFDYPNVQALAEHLSQQLLEFIAPVSVQRK